MWKPGDVALCIQARPYPPEVIKEGRTYTVAGTDGSCCVTRLVLSEVLKAPEEMANWVCIYCKEKAFGFCHWRFIKIAGQEPDVNIEEEGSAKQPITIPSTERLVG